MIRYTVLTQLGDGSFGVVSKARLDKTGELVAVKKIKQRFNSWEECLQLREIQALRRISHPNVIKLKEAIREKTELFLIFELCKQNVYQLMHMRLTRKQQQQQNQQPGHVVNEVFAFNEQQPNITIGISAIPGVAITTSKNITSGNGSSKFNSCHPQYNTPFNGCFSSFSPTPSPHIMIFNNNEIRSILCQTLLGLRACHKAGYTHRDLKPENLLIKGDTIKICDFGLAKEIRSRPPFTEYVSTRWYRAPEIILHSKHYNSPVDVWACGVIFAELYLGRPLFSGTSESDQLFKICSALGSPSQTEWEEGYQLARRMNVRFPNVVPTGLKIIIPQAPPTAIDLMEQMLKFNPSDRLTCSQCLQHSFFTSDNSPISSSLSSRGFAAIDNKSNNIPLASTLFQGIVTGQFHNPFQSSLQQHPVRETSPSDAINNIYNNTNGVNSYNNNNMCKLQRTESIPSDGSNSALLEFNNATPKEGMGYSCGGGGAGGGGTLIGIGSVAGGASLWAGSSPVGSGGNPCAGQEIQSSGNLLVGVTTVLPYYLQPNAQAQRPQGESPIGGTFTSVNTNTCSSPFTENGEDGGQQWRGVRTNMGHNLNRTSVTTNDCGFEIKAGGYAEVG